LTFPEELLAQINNYSPRSFHDNSNNKPSEDCSEAKHNKQRPMTREWDWCPVPSLPQ